jgi:hypothetical protein
MTRCSEPRCQFKAPAIFWFSFLGLSTGNDVEIDGASIGRSGTHGPAIGDLHIDRLRDFDRSAG